MQPMDDKDPSCKHLDRMVQEGDKDDAVYEALARCMAEDLRRFALARCGNARDDVEDITQDALLAARRYLDDFRGDASLRTWLFRLVISACSHRRRGRKNDPGLHRELEDAEPLPGAPDPETSAIMTERLDALRTAIEALRPEDRLLLDQVEWQGQSLAQVAQAHDLSVAAVKSRMFRIRQQLKEQVQARFGDPI